MKTREITIVGVDEADRRVTRTATVLVCPDCDHEAFLIYFIRDPAGQPHKHLQCAACGTCYCQAGQQCRS